MSFMKVIMLKALFNSLLFDEKPEEKDALVITSYLHGAWLNPAKVEERKGTIKSLFDSLHIAKGKTNFFRIGFESDEAYEAAEREEAAYMWCSEPEDVDVAIIMFIAAGLIKLPEREFMENELKEVEDPCTLDIIEVL